MSHVVAICGMMGSGKSTIVKMLRSHFTDCVVLHEDDFNSAPMKSVAEVQNWWNNGANVDEFDLSALGAKLKCEAEAANVPENQIVLLETQFGRHHSELRPWIDLQIWIEVDADIAFARKVSQISRQMQNDNEAHSVAGSLQWISEFCDSYLQTTRKLFIQQRQQVGQQSDERIDGSGCPEDVCEQFLTILSPLTNPST
ncbi:MAG: AAA family ATPase [Fuerstiella sp.]